MLNKSQKYSRKKLALVIVIVLAFSAFSVYFYFKKSDVSRTDSEQSTNQSKDSSIDFGPPTEQEINDVQNHKDSLGDQASEPKDQNQYGQLSVTPVITSADENTVRSYVPSINEDGGICTATFSQGSYTFTKQSRGIRDVTTTLCEPIRTKRSDFTVPGDWKVYISYDSTAAAGKSQESTFRVN